MIGQDPEKERSKLDMSGDRVETKNPTDPVCDKLSKRNSSDALQRACHKMRVEESRESVEKE